MYLIRLLFSCIYFVPWPVCAAWANLVRIGRQVIAPSGSVGSESDARRARHRPDFVAAWDPLHNSGGPVAGPSSSVWGWDARRLFAGNRPAIGKKSNASDRPSPPDHSPQGVMPRVPWVRRSFQSPPIAHSASFKSRPNDPDPCKNRLSGQGDRLSGKRIFVIFAQLVWGVPRRNTSVSCVKLPLSFRSQH